LTIVVSHTLDNTITWYFAGSTTRLHGRLSVYYTAEAPTEEEGEAGKEDELDSDDDSDNGRDDETVVSEANMGDMMFDMDLEGEDDDMELEPQNLKASQTSLLSAGEASTKNRLRTGPPQNSEHRSAKKIPPQVHLKKAEMLLHRVSLRVANELVHPPHETGKDLVESTDVSGRRASEIIKKKKPQMDEFDKRLGLQTTSVNPVTRIASSFLGPLMRIIRIFIYVVRAVFNVYTWRDPFLSFLVFLLLSVWCVVLIWFPWRSFFLAVTVVFVGPQVSQASIILLLDDSVVALPRLKL